MGNLRKTIVRLHTPWPLRLARDAMAGPTTWLSIWRNRRKYDSVEAMPIGLVIFLFVGATIVAAGSGSLLTDVVPSYLKAVSTVPVASWGAAAWGLSVLMLLIAIANIHHTWIALQCQSVIRQRFYR